MPEEIRFFVRTALFGFGLDEQWALFGFGLLLVTIELQVRVVEEPYLQSTHGRRYIDYAGRVGRFIPGVGRTTSPNEKSRQP